MLEHGYCRSLYTEDPNGMLLEFTVDVPHAGDIAADRAQDAHETLRRWLAGDHTSNNSSRERAPAGTPRSALPSRATSSRTVLPHRRDG